MPSQDSEGANHFPGLGVDPLPETAPLEGELISEVPLPDADSLQDPAVSLRRRVGHKLGAPVRGVVRFGNVLGAALDDIKESDQKFRTVSSGLGVAAVQAIGATRAPSILVPITAIDVLQSTGSPTEAGLVTGALFGAWCLTVGETLNNGISRYPAAVKASGDNFPFFVKHFGNSLPGIEAAAERDDLRKISLARHAGSQALTHVRRGLTAVGIGIMPYTVTAGIKGQPKSTIRKLSLDLSTDGGATVGLMSFGLSEVIVNIGHSHPELAQRIQDDAGSAKLWYGVAGGLMVAEWLNNKRKGRKISSQDE